MNTKKTKEVLKKVLEKIEPPKEDLKLIEDSVKEFSEKTEKNLKKLKIDAEVFIGGSFAKKTVIKKDKYDVDVFVRFSKKYRNNEISNLGKKILRNFKNVSVMHGSRDYFRIKVSPDFFIELIPVFRIKNLKEAENITDLSYSHVNYIRRKIKSKKILDDIRIAKAFCHASGCYGAESYINGFSGYSLELLVYYYKGFINFLKGISKIKKKGFGTKSQASSVSTQSAERKEIIDIEKHYKNKKNVLLDVNSSKLISPIILIDPTYKQRNALAALSEETFRKFQKKCKKFLKSPSTKLFEIEKTDLKKIKENAVKNKNEFVLMEIRTNKQEGDVAGSKLIKFYRHLETEISRFFKIKKKGFNYNNKKSARVFFVAKSRKEIVVKGPFSDDRKNSRRFRKEHKKVFVKGKKLCAKEKVIFDLKKFVSDWKTKNRKKMKEMSVSGLEIVS